MVKDSPRIHAGLIAFTPGERGAENALIVGLAHFAAEAVIESKLLGDRAGNSQGHQPISDEREGYISVPI